MKRTNPYTLMLQIVLCIFFQLDTQKAHAQASLIEPPESYEDSQSRSIIQLLERSDHQSSHELAATILSDYPRGGSILCKAALEAKEASMDSLYRFKIYKQISEVIRIIKSQEPHFILDDCPVDGEKQQKSSAPDSTEELEKIGDSSFARAEWTSETFNIDTLRLRVETRQAATCDLGKDVRIYVEGTIGPDSTFAIAKILERNPICSDYEGNPLSRPILILSSGGGVLKDGFHLGNLLRRHSARTIILNKDICASSCAVAFLGGSERIIRDGGAIMFHAPYRYGSKNPIGAGKITCDVNPSILAELKAYYKKMTDQETGSRLYDRTMSYCNESDGWVITGGSAAELYGIATEK